MDFAFTDDQKMLRDNVREALKRACPATAVREAWESGSGRAPGVWSTLADLCVLQMAAPEADDGLGMSLLDLVLPIEECGYAGVPDPVIETAVLGVPLLAQHGGDELRSMHLAAVLAGEASIAVGFASDPFVAHASSSSLLFLERWGQLHGVLREEIDLTPLRSVDRARPLFEARFEPTSKTLLLDGADARHALADLRHRAWIAQGAFLVGLARRMLDMAVDYAKVREQFGKPIGSFQAVKHRLANALLALEFARPVVYRAAWSHTHGVADADVHAAMAKLYAADAAKRVAREALQVHGAIGYTTECDLHFFMKRSWALSSSAGDTATLREHVATAVLGPRSVQE